MGSFLPENEFHDISLMFNNYILKSYGYKTTYLGQNVPRESLISTYKDNTNYVFFIIAKKLLILSQICLNSQVIILKILKFILFLKKRFKIENQY